MQFGICKVSGVMHVVSDVDAIFHCAFSDNLAAKKILNASDIRRNQLAAVFLFFNLPQNMFFPILGTMRMHELDVRLLGTRVVWQFGWVDRLLSHRQK